MGSIFSRAPDGKKTLALFIASNLVNLYMLTVTIPQLTQYSGGLKPFDVMTQGYDIDYARAFLTNLGAEGRSYYLGRHLALDMVYPALYASGGAAAWLWLLSKTSLSGTVLGWIAVLPLLSGGADYIENALQITMLVQFPEVSATVTKLGSMATMLKSSVMTVFIVLLVLLVCTVGVRKWRSRQR